MSSHYTPTYSLGGDSRRSALPVMGLPGAFSSSVLLVSTISLSSVEMTCCCLRGFFLGEAPGIRSPGAFRVEPWEVRAGAEDAFTPRSEGKKTVVYLCVCFLLFHMNHRGLDAAHLAARCPCSPPPV